MARKISAKRRAALIRDLINADFDLTALHDKYGMSPDNLSQWIQDESNHKCLAGLCVLADLQTQLLLSRYRLIAAGKLYELASRETGAGKSDQDIARRACVDLLKLELKRADPGTGTGNGDNGSTAPDSERSLRELLYAADGAGTAALGIGTDRADNTDD
jgi:hypothetical protein